MTTAYSIFGQNDGDVTRKYYADLTKKGVAGEVAVALFRAQKRSSRAKEYRHGRYRQSAYDVKSWSMSEACRLLAEHSKELGIGYGWKEDPNTLFGARTSWVLYVDIPGIGQVSFHSPDRLLGPPYTGEWSGEHRSAERICQFCDRVMGIPEVHRPFDALADGLQRMDRTISGGIAEAKQNYDLEFQ
jgi:hypothetical protein